MPSSTTANPTDVLSLYRDGQAAAQHAGIRYSGATVKGITRKAIKGEFQYFDKHGNKLTDEQQLKRIKALVIPPAWTDVWICPDPDGHLQVTGRDAKGRKQYRYHSKWVASRSLTKFSRMLDFAASLPKIRQQIEKDISRKKLDRQKVTAAVLSLLDTTAIRIGNKEYARQNKSYGLTTLRDRHVQIDGSTIYFDFVGKKSVAQHLSINNLKLARIVQRCKELPGYELFQYLDEDGERHTLQSDDVNEYIRVACGEDFTAKDFRTWAGTVNMLKCLSKLKTEEVTDAEKCIKQAVKEVARSLGNTPSVCLKYYIHPAVCEAFKAQKIKLALQNESKMARVPAALSDAEKLVVKLLRKVDKTH